MTSSTTVFEAIYDLGKIGVYYKIVIVYLRKRVNVEIKEFCT